MGGKKVKSMDSGVKILDMNLSFSLNLFKTTCRKSDSDSTPVSSTRIENSNLQTNLVKAGKAHKKICTRRATEYFIITIVTLLENL